MTPPGPLDRVLGAIVPRAVDALDIDGVISQVDINQLVAEVDIDAIIKRVDIDAIMARVDIDALMARVDIDSIMQRAHIDSIVSNASRGVFAKLIDSARRLIVGLDLLIIGVTSRVFHRDEQQQPIGDASVTGRVAGGVSRLSAFLIDVAMISIAFSVTVSIFIYMIELFSPQTVNPADHTALWIAGITVFAFFYYWVSLMITGRSIGKGLIGLRVVATDGSPISPGHAAIRTLVYPFSFILALGLIPIITGRQRRALHDFAGGDKVLYDWGDRPAEMPAPLSDWIDRRTQAAQLQSFDV